MTQPTYNTMSITPATLTIAHGGNTQQFTCSEKFVAWSLRSGAPTTEGAAGIGSTVGQTGLFTSGPTIAESLTLIALREDGKSVSIAITVT